MGVQAVVKNYDKLVKEIEAMKKAPRKVMSATMREIKDPKRGQSWIASGVAQKYNIKPKEITGGKIGYVRFRGDTISKLQIEYNGRMLTPTHFGMSPKKPSASGTYNLQAEFLKGKKETLGKVRKLSKKQRAALTKNFTHSGTRNSPSSPWMLQKTGAKSEDKVQYIPFQRRTQPGKMKYVMKSISLPQMVTEGKNGPMHAEVAKSFNDNLEKRFNHYMDRYMGK